MGVILFIDITKQELDDIKDGKKNPTQEILKNIAHFFNIKYEDLLEKFNYCDKMIKE